VSQIGTLCRECGYLDPEVPDQVVCPNCQGSMERVKVERCSVEKPVVNCMEISHRFTNLDDWHVESLEEGSE